MHGEQTPRFDPGFQTANVVQGEIRNLRTVEEPKVRLALLIPHLFDELIGATGVVVQCTLKSMEEWFRGTTQGIASVQRTTVFLKRACDCDRMDSKGYRFETRQENCVEFIPMLSLAAKNLCQRQTNHTLLEASDYS